MTATPRNKEKKCAKLGKSKAKQTKVRRRKERSQGNLEEGKNEGKAETKG
jgi:hypothetical protein